MASNNNQNGWFSSLGIGFGGGSSTVNASPEKPTAPLPSGSQPEISHFDQLDRTANASNTLKRNTKIEFTRSDLLQLLSYYEGEFQARDIVIAALKSEKLKEVVNVGRYRPVVLNDPYTALLRDMFADGPSAKPPYSDKDISMLADQQLEALENLVVQHRRAQVHMANIIRDAELKHKKVIQELEEEKYKHEHDTAQGDDITYGLEMERTRLKQELDLERQARKKLEKELKRQLEVADEEKARQKQIVLLLLAERKKIILKYIEERKRSEDLAQILSEEKTRIDTMAEGLEEESKKSLQMEAELEKQMQIFDTDRKALQNSLAEQEKRYRELEADLRKTKTEYESLRSQVLPVRSKCSPRSTDDTSAAPMTSSVAKVVQPTATVSSVPVCGPTTGIAQSISPGQGLRQTATPVITPPKVNVTIQGQTGVARIHTSAVTIATPNVRPLSPAQLSNKAAFQGAAVVQPPPPKKGAILGRGLPPPIPPNKPVIATKQSVQRRSDQTDGDKKKPAQPPGSKDTSKLTHSTAASTAAAAAAAVSAPTATSSGGTAKPAAGGTDEQQNTGTPAAAAGHPHPPGIEMLGQELADFQQMFVTMATGNNS